VLNNGKHFETYNSNSWDILKILYAIRSIETLKHLHNLSIVHFGAKSALRSLQDGFELTTSQRMIAWSVNGGANIEPPSS
jgi:hypothetical protein